MARWLLGSGVAAMLATGVFLMASPRDAAPHNLYEPACRMDGLVGNNPKSVKAGEFEVTGTYVPPTGATNFSVTVMILESIGPGGIGWATHPATMDATKKTWSATVLNQKPDSEHWVGVRCQFMLDGNQMDQPAQELRKVRIK